MPMDRESIRASVFWKVLLTAVSRTRASIASSRGSRARTKQSFPISVLLLSKVAQAAYNTYYLPTYLLYRTYQVKPYDIRYFERHRNQKLHATGKARTNAFSTVAMLRSWLATTQLARRRWDPAPSPLFAVVHPGAVVSSSSHAYTPRGLRGDRLARATGE